MSRLRSGSWKRGAVLSLSLSLSLSLVLLGGCSLVFSPSDHRGGEAGVDAGVVDAGPMDGGPDAGPDSGPMDAGPMDAGQVSSIQFCPAFVAHYCAARARCCEQAPMETEQACANRLITRCNETAGEVVADSRSGYRPRRGAQLMADIDTAAATCDASALELLGIGGLRRTLAGTIPVSEDCELETAFACVQPNLCVRQNILRWECQATPAEEGDRCFLDSECAAGLRCQRMPIGMERCAPLIEDGQSCQRSDECVSSRCGGSDILECVPANQQTIYCPSPFEETVGDI